MNIPRDPNVDPPRPDPLVQEPTGETRGRAARNETGSSWGLLPGLIGIVIVIALGLMIFAGGDDTTTPDRTGSTDVQTPATAPKTTPTQPQ